MNKEQLITNCKKAKKASKKLLTATSKQKNQVLFEMSKSLQKQADALKNANQIDRQKAKLNQLSDAMIDRLTINDKVIAQMCESLHEVAELRDPLVTTTNEITRPNGIKVGKKRIPLGIILMIYESRPNVTVEAASLALKSGNGIILRGGKEAFETNQVIAKCWQEALSKANLPQDLIQVLATTERSILNDLLKLDELIDVVIPRGGESLIKYVVANSYIPVIKHYQGICHLYVDRYANLEKALNLLVNGKTQRPGVCNALEGLLVDQDIAKTFLPQAQKALEKYNVELLGCDKTQAILPQIQLATEQDFATEFLSLKITIKVVSDIEEAIEFIDQYGSGHTEVIATENQQHAEQFINRIDASVVMANASSRFSDGGELGLGAEIGISTSKIHAYGPMGLESLTSEKFVVIGEGQVRG